MVNEGPFFQSLRIGSSTATEWPLQSSLARARKSRKGGGGGRATSSMLSLIAVSSETAVSAVLEHSCTREVLPSAGRLVAVSVRCSACCESGIGGVIAGLESRLMRMRRLSKPAITPPMPLSQHAEQRTLTATSLPADGKTSRVQECSSTAETAVSDDTAINESMEEVARPPPPPFLLFRARASDDWSGHSVAVEEPIRRDWKNGPSFTKCGIYSPGC